MRTLLLKRVSHYDLSALSMSVMGFKKKRLDSGGWVVETALSSLFFEFTKTCRFILLIRVVLMTETCFVCKIICW